jgi:drug/metabolite transporter (DMT)-like permease
MGPYGAGVLFTLIVGFSFLCIKICVGMASPFETLAWRYNFSLLPCVLMPVIGASWPRFAKDGSKEGSLDLFLAAAFYATSLILQATGLLYATSVESGIFFAVVPVFAKVMAAVILKEHASRDQNIFMCLSVGSLIAMIICGAGHITMSVGGAALLLVSSFCMALCNVFMRRVRNRYGPGEIAVALTLVGFVACNVITLTSAVKNGDLASYLNLAMNPRFLLATAYLGVLSTFFTSFLMGYMTKRLDSLKSTIFANLASAISVAVGAIFLSEPLYWYHIVFTAAIIVGVIGVSMSGMKEPRP